MDAVEKTGKTIEEAVEAALNELGLERDEVEVEVLSETQKSRFLGLGSQTEVSVRVIPRAQNQPEFSGITSDEVGAEIEDTEDVVLRGRKLSEAEQHIRDLIQEILEKVGAEARVEILRSDANGVHANIEGDDLGFIIGKRGQTLHALQYLVNTILNHEALRLRSGQALASEQRDGGARVLLDAASYRDRRHQALQRMARRAAEKAKQRGRRVRLDPMPSYERRVIHVTLADEPGVKTFSSGEEPHRQVVIEPTGPRPAPQRQGYGPAPAPRPRPPLPGKYRTSHRPSPNRQRVDSRFFDDMFKDIPPPEPRKDE